MVQYMTVFILSFIMRVSLFLVTFERGEKISHDVFFKVLKGCLSFPLGVIHCNCGDEQHIPI